MLGKDPLALTESRRDWLGNGLLFCMYTLEVAYLYSASTLLLIPCGILGILALAGALRSKSAIPRLLVGIALAVVALVSINRVWVLNCSWSGCLRIVFVSLPLAYLLHEVRIHRRLALVFFYVVFAYTALMVYLADPAELYRIFAASSRNYISVLLIACLFPYYLACTADGDGVSIVPALLSFVLSVYVQSRGGVVASGILLVLTLIRTFRLGKRRGVFKNNVLLTCCVLAGALLLIIGFLIFGNPARYLSRFVGSEEYSITRMDMWSEYLKAMGSSVQSVVLGPPLTTCPLILEEGYNIHNSYLMTHAYMGIVGFLTVLAGGIGYLVLCIKRRQYDLLFLTLAFLCRAMTDYLFPMLFCDCIMLFMVIETGTYIMGMCDEHTGHEISNHSDSSI